jgi:hypothetical protein
MLQQLLLRASPSVLGSLLVGAVGSQQASQIQKDLALGNISLDDVANFITNFTASPAVSYLQDKEKENQLTPQDEDDKKPKAPEPDPTDLLNLLKDDNNERDETKTLTNTPRNREEGSVIGTQELKPQKENKTLLQGRLPSDLGTHVLRYRRSEKLALMLFEISFLNFNKTNWRPNLVTKIFLDAIARTN